MSRLVKQLEAEGPASRCRCVLRAAGAPAAGRLRAPFRIVDFTVIAERRGGESRAEASVKVEVDGEVLHTAADGNRPVHALDLALRKALGAFYPALDGVHLVDYKVRIIDGDAATAARTRVIIETGHESGTWITAGADANIITASLIALHDSFEYAIWQLDAHVPSVVTSSPLRELRSVPDHSRRRRHRDRRRANRHAGRGTRRGPPGHRCVGLLRGRHPDRGRQPQPRDARAPLRDQRVRGASGVSPGLRRALRPVRTRALRTAAPKCAPASRIGAESADDLLEITLELLRRNGHDGDAYVRPIIYKAAHSIRVQLSDLEDRIGIFTIPLGDYLPTGGIRVTVSGWQRVSDNAIPARGKIAGSYVNAALATEDAHAGGYDDALLLTADGHVAEASAANIFAVFGREVATPPLVDDVLPGITRGAILEIARDAGYDVVERRIDRSELYLADEVFLTGTGAQVAPVASIDDRPVGDPDFPIALDIQARYFAAVRGTDARYARWLTPIPEGARPMNLSPPSFPIPRPRFPSSAGHQRQRAIEPREPDPHRRWPPMARQRRRQWSRRRAPPRRRQRARAAPRHGGGARVVRRPRGRHRARGEGVDLRGRSSQRRLDGPTYPGRAVHDNVLQASVEACRSHFRPAD